MSIRLSTGGLGLPQIITRGLGGYSLVVGDDFWVALRTYLVSVKSLGGLQGVYYRRTPPKFAMPCLIFTPISDIPRLTTRKPIGVRRLFNSRYCQMMISRRIRWGMKVYRALAPKAPRPRIRAITAYEMTAIPGVRHHAMQAGRGPENKNVWAHHCQFTFLIGRTMIEIL